MAVEQNSAAVGPSPAAEARAAIPEVKIVHDIPVLFADGVMSHSYITGLTKFYLYRTDTTPDVIGGSKNITVCQVIMPAQGFATMLHFLEHRLNLMVADNAISKEAVEQIRAFVYPDPQEEKA